MLDLCPSRIIPPHIVMPKINRKSHGGINAHQLHYPFGFGLYILYVHMHLSTSHQNPLLRDNGGNRSDVVLWSNKLHKVR